MSSLVMIDRITKGSGVSSQQLKLTGIDSTYDKYVVIGKNFGTHYNTTLDIRVTKSGTPHTSSDYEQVGYNLIANSTSIRARTGTANSIFQIWVNSNGTNIYNYGTGMFYLYLTNFADATKYDYMQLYGVMESNDQQGYNAPMSACVVKNASASDGVIFTQSSGVNNIFFGEIALFGIK